MLSRKFEKPINYKFAYDLAIILCTSYFTVDTILIVTMVRNYEII